MPCATSFKHNFIYKQNLENKQQITIVMKLWIVLLLFAASAESFNGNLLVVLPEGNGTDTIDCRASVEISMAQANAKQLFSMPLQVQFLNSSPTTFEDILNHVKTCQQDCFKLVTGHFTDSLCNKASVFLPLYNWTALTSGCRSPTFTGTAKLSRIIRTQIPIEQQNFIKLKFISSVGEWANVVVITQSPGIGDFNWLSQHFRRLANNILIQVPIFHQIIGNLTRQDLEKVKKTGYRIIAADFIMDQKMALDFLCLTFDLEMTSKQGYVFIINSRYFVSLMPESGSVDSYPCGVGSLWQQMNAVFWIGDIVIQARNLPGKSNTVLGYDVKGFELTFFTRFNRLPKASLAIDCHDTFLQSILTLKDVKLTDPFIPLANDGNPLQFSASDLEMHSMLQWVYQIDNESKALVPIYTVQMPYGGQWDNSFDYIIKPVPQYKIRWGTPWRPVGQINKSTSIQPISVVARGIIWAGNAVFIIGQLYSLVITFILLDYRPVMSTLPRTKLVLLEGLLYLNVASVICLVNDLDYPNLLCRFRYFMIAIALCRSNGIVVAKIFISFFKTRFCNQQNVPPNELVDTCQTNDRFCLFFSTIYTLLALLIMLVWFIVDPVVVIYYETFSKLTQIREEIVNFEWCYSTNQYIYLIILTVYILAPCFIASLMAIFIRNSKNAGFDDIRWWKFSVWLQLLIYTLAIITVEALGEGQFEAKLIAISAYLVILSGAIDSFVFFPNGRRNLRAAVNTVFNLRPVDNISKVAVVKIEVPIVEQTDDGSTSQVKRSPRAMSRATADDVSSITNSLKPDSLADIEEVEEEDSMGGLEHERREKMEPDEEDIASEPADPTEKLFVVRNSMKNERRKSL